ncbi:putative uncharacterized protein [Methylocaldum marinum]|uniref:Uncharacterized protein n=1 Tax=Methylocaldum marinum TaxID=1432792 RepID=A0A286P4F7_9GAMM|nr:putative uncharacterized protein [Methylocaldum marinum]
MNPVGLPILFLPRYCALLHEKALVFGVFSAEAPYILGREFGAGEGAFSPRPGL